MRLYGTHIKSNGKLNIYARLGAGGGGTVRGLRRIHLARQGDTGRRGGRVADAGYCRNDEGSGGCTGGSTAGDALRVADYRAAGDRVASQAQ